MVNLLQGWILESDTIKIAPSDVAAGSAPIKLLQDWILLDTIKSRDAAASSMLTELLQGPFIHNKDAAV